MTTIAKLKEKVFESVAQAAEAHHRSPKDVIVIGVTKYVSIQDAQELVSAGVTHLAENRVDQFLEKKEALGDQPLTWHLIGSLQRRKVKDVINHVDYFHALDSLSLATEIQKRAQKPINCFLQVNISGEESKHGFALDQVKAAVQEMVALDKVNLVGVMTMAPLGASDDELNDIFEKAQALNKELRQLDLPHMPFTELSMGMSGDYSQAIANGATFVRIGSSFFNK